MSKKDIVLLIWSEHSSRSDWVKNEWLTASALGKPIKIVIISDLQNAPLPKSVENTESIVFEKDNIDSNIQKMSEGLKRNTQSFHKQYDYNILPPKVTCHLIRILTSQEETKS